VSVNFWNCKKCFHVLCESCKKDLKV
jgi:hypothetical protein